MWVYTAVENRLVTVEQEEINQRKQRKSSPIKKRNDMAAGFATCCAIREKKASFDLSPMTYFPIFFIQLSPMLA
jgi:hypothetical protein